MSSFETVRDIVDHAKVFHRRLSEAYTKLGDRSDRERIKVLLTYMSRHQEHVAECLAELETTAARRIMDTWFKFTPKMKHEKCFECINLDANMTTEEIVSTTLRVDKCLVGFYEQAASNAVSQDVRDLFAKLLEMEKKEETQCLRNMVEFDAES
jgi:hypothetical protein